LIYLDNAATTKPSQTAINDALIFNETAFYNPSALYREGIKASQLIKDAKNYILSTITSSKHDLIFTSCGTESDNQAIFCAVKRGIFVTTKGEHSAVQKCFIELKNKNIQTEFIDLNSDGSVNEEKLYSFIKDNPNVTFVSIVHVNNETGAINDINKIAKNIKAINKDIIFHSDGVQAYGKIPFKLCEYVDLYSISAHKINAFKGTGALIKKKGLNLSPYILGGGQENGLRSGTENLFGIKVFEFAAKEHYSTIKNDFEYVKTLKSAFLDKIDKEIFTIISSDNCSPYVVSVSAKGLKGEIIMHSLETEGIIVGNGSACSSKNPHSRVIEACGYDLAVLSGVVRVSFSNKTTLEEVEIAVTTLNNVARKLKNIMGK
jgi:cysteine desulfurase